MNRAINQLQDWGIAQLYRMWFGAKQVSDQQIALFTQAQARLRQREGR